MSWISMASGWLADFMGHWGVLVIFLTVFLQELNIPLCIPNEFLIAFAVFALPRPEKWLAILAVAVVADIAAYALSWWLGKHLGEQTWNFYLKFVWPTGERHENLLRFVRKNGHSGIFRMFSAPKYRAWIGLYSGLYGKRSKPVTHLTFAASLLWVESYALLGQVAKSLSIGPGWFTLVWATVFGIEIAFTSAVLNLDYLD